MLFIGSYSGLAKNCLSMFNLWRLHQHPIAILNLYTHSLCCQFLLFIGKSSVPEVTQCHFVVGAARNAYRRLLFKTCIWGSNTKSQFPLPFPLCEVLSFIYPFSLLLFNVLMVCKNYEFQEAGSTTNGRKFSQKRYIFSPQKANNLNVCYSKKVTQLRINRLFCRCQSTLTK